MQGAPRRKSTSPWNTPRREEEEEKEEEEEEEEQEERTRGEMRVLQLRKTPDFSQRMDVERELDKQQQSSFSGGRENCGARGR